MEKTPAVWPKPFYGMFPVFVGFEKTLERLRDLPEWKDARAVKITLSLPIELRNLAFRDGKIVYVSIIVTPGLTEEKCYIELKPDFFNAADPKAAYLRGQDVGPWEMRKIDLCVTSSMAVTIKGCAIGHGMGGADLSYAICKEHGIISDKTTIVAIAHPLQVVDYDVPVGKHDMISDYIITTEKIIKTDGHYPQPKGIYWEDLREEYKNFPILKRMRRRLDWVNTWGKSKYYKDVA
jgi:5-formyltetrahydrofolate cyclo-ligase